MFVEVCLKSGCLGRGLGVVWGGRGLGFWVVGEVEWLVFDVCWTLFEKWVKGNR